jgi:hypothetical protein
MKMDESTIMGFILGFFVVGWSLFWRWWYGPRWDREWEKKVIEEPKG